MVKKLKAEDFINQLDSFYSASKEKNSVYLTFKRIYEEKFKNKKNKKVRRMRNVDRKEQDQKEAKFNVLVRAKLKKSRIQTIVIVYLNIQLNESEIDKFHHILMNVLTLHFIRDESKIKKKEKRMPIKKASKTQKRKIKRLRKIKVKTEKTEINKMQVDIEVNNKAITK